MAEYLYLHIFMFILAGTSLSTSDNLNLTVKNANSSVIVVQWPTEQNDSYCVKATPENQAFENYTCSRNFFSPFTVQNLTDGTSLTSQTRYRIYLFAGTEYDNITACTSPGPVKSLQALVDENIVKWSKPLGGNELDYYNLTYYDGFNFNREIVYVSKTDSTVTQKNFSFMNNREYNFSVFAHNCGGEGIISIITTQTAAGQPIIKSIVYGSSNTSTVLIHFGQPDGGAELYEANFSSSDFDPYFFSNNTSPIVAHNLIPGTFYNIEVIAVGFKRNSTPAIGNITMVPQYVADLKAISCGFTWIFLKWSLPNGSYTNLRLSFNKNNTMKSGSTFPDNQTNYNLTSLQSGATYSIEIIVISNNLSSIAQTIITTTKTAGPSALHNINQTTTSIYLEWTAAKNVSFFYYALYYRSNSSHQVNLDEIPSNNTTHNVTNLTPGTLYIFNLFAVGDNNSTAINRSFPSVPGSVVNLTVAQNVLNATNSLDITWKNPEGQGEQIVIKYSLNGSLHNATLDFMKENAIISNLLPGNNYTFYVYVTSNGLNSMNMTSSFNTKPDRPNIILVSRTSNSITIMVRKLYGNVESFNLTWQEVHSNEGLNSTLLNTDHQNYIIADLNAYTNYKIEAFSQIYGYTGKIDKSATTSIVLQTYSDAPPPPNTMLFNNALQSSKVTESTISFILTPGTFSFENGIIEVYAVLIVQKVAFVSGLSSNTRDHCIQGNVGSSPCVALWTDSIGVSNRKKRNANNENQSISFVIGNSVRSISPFNNIVYSNYPLAEATEYLLAVGAKNFNNSRLAVTSWSGPIRTDGTSTSRPIGLIIGIVVAAIGCVVLFIFIVLYRKEKLPCGRNNTKEIWDEPLREIQSKPVLLSEFSQHMTALRADSDLKFSEEYEELCQVGRNQSTVAALLPENRPKNRYTNILPYDATRVKLDVIDDIPGSDYVNANFLPGNNHKQEYIAAQGPLENTIEDFWRMVWEHNCRNVVMLTKTVEGGRKKCEQYWPSNYEPTAMSKLALQMTSESVLPEWTIREFVLSKDSETRRIRQFHYMVWPDHGVPELTVVRFVRYVRGSVDRESKHTGPSVIHCSAGVGRTGTFIVLDRLFQSLPTRSNIDIFNLVYQMRKNRVFMVQTEVQYIFIHEIVLQYINGTLDENDADPVYENTRTDLFTKTDFSIDPSGNGNVNQAMISPSDDDQLKKEFESQSDSFKELTDSNEDSQMLPKNLLSTKGNKELSYDEDEKDLKNPIA